MIKPKMKIKWKWRVFVVAAIIGYAGTFLAFMSLSASHQKHNKIKSIDISYLTGVNINDSLNDQPKYQSNQNQVDKTTSLLSKLITKMKESENDWQEVKANLLYVYSAYHDTRTNQLVIVGAVDSQRAAITTRVAFWRHNKPNNPTFEQALISIHPEKHGKRFVAAYIICDMSKSITPDYVSVYARVNIGFESKLHMTNNILPVIKVKDAGSRRSTFSVCVSPLHSKVSENTMVEFIEVNRIFGAEKFIFYNFLINNTFTDPYINYYSNQNVAVYHKWSLPSVLQKDIYYFAQITALNDCLYKTMFHTKYVAFLDLDEFIIPMQKDSWRDILAHTQVAKMNKTAGVYSFQNVFFKEEWPSDESYKYHPMVSKYNVKTLLKIYRENKVFPHRERSKLIAIPERINKVGLYYVHQFSDKKYKTVKIPYSQAMLFHYRNWDEPDKPTEIMEKRMHLFADDIIKRISNIHLAVKGIL